MRASNGRSDDVAPAGFLRYVVMMPRQGTRPLMIDAAASRLVAPLSLVLPILLAQPIAAEAACTDPPAEAQAPVAELVARTATIVLATAEKAEELFHISNVGRNGKLVGRTEIRYTFTADETLKGRSDAGFMLEISAVDPVAAEQSAEEFDHHREPGWREKGGRVGAVASDCEVSPRFDVGARYLIFVDKPWHVLGFERIAVDDDEWLGEVRRLIADGGQ
jgi:hypothetical protein